MQSSLLIFFTPQPSIWIGDLDGELSCSLNNNFPILRGYIVSDLSTVRFVAHQEHLELFDVVHQKLPESTREHVFCLLIASITNIGHQDLALESSSHPVVNAPWFTPVSL